MCEDYPGVAALEGRLFGDVATSEAERRFDDAHREARCRHARFVLEQDGQIIGMAEYDQKGTRYVADRFLVDVQVAPEHTGRGFGAALYDHVLRALRPAEGFSTVAFVQEDHANAVRFVQRRGFVEERRTFPSKCDVQAFPFQRFAGWEERLETHGVRLMSLDALAGDPERDRKLWELDWRIRQDIPATEPAQEQSFEAWRAEWLDHPHVVPSLYLVAVRDGAYVGLSCSWHDPEEADVYTRITGVLPACRRMGIAMALKLRGLMAARDYGAPIVHTFNDSTNTAMRAINDRLGFQRQPALIHFVKTWTAAEAAEYQP